MLSKRLSVFSGAVGGIGVGVGSRTISVGVSAPLVNATTSVWAGSMARSRESPMGTRSEPVPARRSLEWSAHRWEIHT